mgnify:CR=1 FL=1
MAVCFIEFISYLSAEAEHARRIIIRSLDDNMLQGSCICLMLILMSKGARKGHNHNR